MKSFRTKLSVTKLVLILMTLILGFQTVYLTLEWIETSLFNNVMIAIVSYYFGQKAMQYKEVDSLVREDKEEKSDLEEDLPNNNEI